MVPHAFWLHMNESYMWQWFCSDTNGSLVATSVDWFFSRADAEKAMLTARHGMALTIH
jgi:hypothetical protein